MKKNRSRDRKKFWVRVICLVLCVLLAGGSIVSLIWYLL